MSRPLQKLQRLHPQALLQASLAKGGCSPVTSGLLLRQNGPFGVFSFFSTTSRCFEAYGLQFRGQDLQVFGSSLWSFVGSQSSIVVAGRGLRRLVGQRSTRGELSARNAKKKSVLSVKSSRQYCFQSSANPQSKVNLCLLIVVLLGTWASSLIYSVPMPRNSQVLLITFSKSASRFKSWANQMDWIKLSIL